ncbi:MAG: hypothetical protein QXT68_04345 [Halobacteria archaeon]
MTSWVEGARAREKEALNLLGLSTAPGLCLIGGYAMRAYMDHLRYSEDCDFAVQGLESMGRVKGLMPPGYALQREEADPRRAFLRYEKPVGRFGKFEFAVSADFLFGAVEDRRSGVLYPIDEGFLGRARMEAVRDEFGKTAQARVASREDLFLLKLISARALDFEDVATSLLDRGLPDTDVLRELIQSANLGEFCSSRLDALAKMVAGKKFRDDWAGRYRQALSEAGQKRAQKRVAELREAVGFG